MDPRTAPQPIKLDREFTMMAKEKLAQLVDSSSYFQELDEKEFSLFVGQEPEVVEQEVPKEIKTTSVLESLISGLSELLKGLLRGFKQDVLSTMSKLKTISESVFSPREIVLQMEAFIETSSEFTEIKL
jgi:hypothetical protein